jgi:type I restriction enzyme S subunit
LDETEQHISELGLASSAAVLHPAGTVMFCRTASVGLFCITGRPMATTQAFVTWTPGPHLDGRYLLYVIAALRPEFERLAYGSTHLTIYMPDLEALRVPVPPLDEQRRIADFLDDQAARIDSMSSARRRQVGLLQEEFKSWHADQIGELTRVLDPVPLRRFCDGIEQGASPVADAMPAELGECGVLQTSAIRSGIFTPTANKRLRDESLFERRYEVRDGDVLVARGSGSADLVGDVCHVDGMTMEGIRLMLSDLTYRLVGSRLEPRFLVAALLAPQARAQLRAAVRQGSGPAKARGEDILSLLVPPASEAVQRDVAAEYWRGRSHLESRVAMLDRSVRLLDDLTRSLISAAVAGELDVASASGRGVPR